MFAIDKNAYNIFYKNNNRYHILLQIIIIILIVFILYNIDLVNKVYKKGVVVNPKIINNIKKEEEDSKNDKNLPSYSYKMIKKDGYDIKLEKNLLKEVLLFKTNKKQTVNLFGIVRKKYSNKDFEKYISIIRFISAFNLVYLINKFSFINMLELENKLQYENIVDIIILLPSVIVIFIYYFKIKEITDTVLHDYSLYFPKLEDSNICDNLCINCEFLDYDKEGIHDPRGRNSDCKVADKAGEKKYMLKKMQQNDFYKLYNNINNFNNITFHICILLIIYLVLLFIITVYKKLF